ncbi:MAG: class I SAM-dependent methyltransferase [Pseudomonadota bacterium]
MNDSTSRARVRAFYNDNPAREWNRLSQSWLECQITRQMIDRVLTRPSRVLDIGGGPGVYALDLAANGHRVDLVDLSSANIAFAKAKARERGVTLHSADVGDATCLRDHDTETYDLILCLGPLYHLLEHDDRQRAVREAVRVLKPGGVGFFAYLSRYAPIFYQLKTDPEAIADMEATIDTVLETGLHSPGADDNRFFTDSCFVDPLTIGSDMGAFGLEEICVFGAEGGMAQSEAALLSLDDGARTAWQQVALRLATTTVGACGSEHVVYVGRKTR